MTAGSVTQVSDLSSVTNAHGPGGASELQTQTQTQTLLSYNFI